MAAKSDPDALARIVQKLDSIDRRLDMLEQGSRPASTPTVVAEEPLRPFFISFDSVPGDRKPYALAFRGSEPWSVKLSSVRTALLLTLFVDLKLRMAGQPGIEDVVAKASGILSQLEEDKKDANVVEATRVAYYRLTDFLVDELAELFLGKQVPLELVDGRIQARPSWWKKKQLNALEILTSDHRISSILNNAFETSPLERVRRAKTLFVPQGDDSHDRVQLQLFDHQYLVHVHSLYYRPTVQSIPIDILERYGASQNRIRRNQLVQEGYRTGRVRYTEILNRKTLLQMINEHKSARPIIYPAGVGLPDVIQHFDFLIDRVRNQKNYQLILSDAEFPFYLTTCAIDYPSGKEYYVLLFQEAKATDFHQIRSFILHEPQIYRGIQESIVEWVIGHPSTQTNRENVEEELHRYRHAAVEQLDGVVNLAARRKKVPA